MYQVGKVEPIIFALHVEIGGDDGVKLVFLLIERRGFLSALDVGQKGHIVGKSLIFFDSVHAVAEGKIFESKAFLRKNTLQNALLIFFVHDHKILGIGEKAYLFFEYFVAGAVKGQDPAAVSVRHQRAYAVAHFARRFVRESDGEYMLGRDAEFLHDIGIAQGEHARLSAARSRRNAHAPLRALHGSALIFVQSFQKIVESHFRSSNICSKIL